MDECQTASSIEGPDPTAASVTFLGVEPLDVLRFESPDGLVRYVTLGCSRHPMGDPNELVADPTRGPRAELVLTLRGGTGVASGVARTLAVLAAAPSVEGVVLLEDALLDLGEPLWKDTAFTAPFDPVRFLGVVPLTGTEAAWVRLRGAEALREAWTEAGIDIRDPHRSAASL
eukprot:gene25600-30739_t